MGEKYKPTTPPTQAPRLVILVEDGVIIGIFSPDSAREDYEIIINDLDAEEVGWAAALTPIAKVEWERLKLQAEVRLAEGGRYMT
jgi:hypothetical protein